MTRGGMALGKAHQRKLEQIIMGLFTQKKVPLLGLDISSTAVKLLELSQ